MNSRAGAAYLEEWNSLEARKVSVATPSVRGRLSCQSNLQKASCKELTTHLTQGFI